VVSDLHTNGIANRALTGAQDDIVGRLDGCRVPLTVEGDGWVKLLDAAAAEIERLRQRGDNLHTVAVEMPNPRHNLSWLAWRTQMDNALMGWEEARRG
jgi:hypothetical protein